MYNASLERDENFVPRVQEKADTPHSDSAMEDAPFYTLGRLLVQQIIGLHLYFSKSGFPDCRATPSPRPTI